MELKRYVLMNNGKILDLRKIGFTKYISIEEMVKNYGKVKSTSDNILDFVEVGDLVELKNDTRIVHIHNQRWLDDFLSKVQEPEEDEFKIKDNIVAIYKRQQNGDYKHYEVK